VISGLTGSTVMSANPAPDTTEIRWSRSASENIPGPPDPPIGGSGTWAAAATPGPNERLTHRATETGWHFVEVKMGRAGTGRYTLRIDKQR